MPDPYCKGVGLEDVFLDMVLPHSGTLSKSAFLCPDIDFSTQEKVP